MNPFRDTIVSSPWEAGSTDVPEIHGDLFEECLQGIEYVRQQHRSTSLLIHGAYGSGKTHLLRRLRTRLTLQAPTATDRDESLFAWIRLQASPRMIWRHVRRTLVEDWFRPVRGQSTQFERILFHRLAEIRVANGDLEPWYEYMLDTDPAGLEELLERVADTLHLDRNTTIAFKHLAFGRRRRDLRAWLAGDSLPEEALNRLGLSQDEGTDEDREHEARRVILMLCRLAGDGLPIVLSLDQVEALQVTHGDREALFAFGQLVSTIHDETSNVLTISCIQSSFVTELKDKARQADYNRMTSFGAKSLATLTRQQAQKLIDARLNLLGPEFTRPVQDPLWPLDAEDFGRLTERDELTPRRLLAVCAERFDGWKAGQRRNDSSPAVAVTPPEAPGDDAFLDGEWKERVEQLLSQSQPERTEQIVRHGLPQLVRLIAPQWKTVSDDLLPDVPLVFEGPSGRTGVSVCSQANMNSVAAQLKRLKTQFAPDRLSRLVIVRDGRVPLSKTAKVASQALSQLVDQGAVVAEYSAEMFAALDALRALLSDARSGDLAQDGRGVGPQTVEEWLTRNMPDSLRDLIDCVTGISERETSNPTESLRLEGLATALATRPVMTVDEVAEALSCSRDAIVDLVERHPDRARFLAGPPAVVFRVETDPASREG